MAKRGLASGLAESAVAVRRLPDEWKVETRFLSLGKPAQLGERIEGWRVCWLGGWDKSKVLYKVMVERVVRNGPCSAAVSSPRYDPDRAIKPKRRNENPWNEQT